MTDGNPLPLRGEGWGGGSINESRGAIEQTSKRYRKREGSIPYFRTA
jgi:hypothetical protein